MIGRSEVSGRDQNEQLDLAQFEAKRVAFTRTTCVVGVVLIAFLSVISYIMPGITSAKIFGFLAAGVFLALSAASRANVNYGFLVSAFVVVALLLTSLAAMGNGGITGYLTPFLLIIPLAAGYFYNRKMSVFAAGFAILCCVGLYLASHFSIATPTPYSDSAIQIGALLSLIISLALGVFSVCALLAEIEKATDYNKQILNDLQDKIEEANKEQSKVRQMQNRLRAIYDTEPECVKIVNRDACLVDMNPAGLEMIEADNLEQVKGANLLDIVAPPYHSLFLKGLEDVFAGKKSRQEFEIVGLNGKRRWMQQSAVPLPDAEGASEIKEMLAVTRDITENVMAMRELEHQKELAESASRAKTSFLATMSHEIRTPMNGVLGATKILKKQQLDPEMERYVGVIRECGKSLMGILNDILDISKLESGKLELEKTTFRLSEVLQSIYAIYNLKAEEKSIIFRSEIDSSIHDFRLGDPHRLTQILHNLVANAMKFTHEGSVSIEVSETKGATGDAPSVTISVSDTGVGMTDEQISDIFDSFVQADSSTTRQYGGSGLGLSIVKGLVDAMSGEVAVRSEKGKGTTFCVTIPLPVADAFQEESDLALSEEESDLNSIAILVAEDNAINRLVLDAFLKPTGASVTFCENGKLAVDAYRSGDYDIVLMDVHMPVMDGSQALFAIREIEEAESREHTPVVVVTADAMQHQVNHYQGLGFDDYLSKPINEKLLIKTVRKNTLSSRACDRSSDVA